MNDSKRGFQMSKSTVFDCTIIELDKHHSEKGNISVVENGKTVPFDVQRVYYLYDVPGGEARGGHAHKELSQLIIAASGSFDVILYDGNLKRTFTLNRPYQGLYVTPGMWRNIDNFSSGSVCLVLASMQYSEIDYIRDYNSFINYCKIKNTENFELNKYGLYVRLVNEGDAEFILQLRTNSKLCRYIHETEINLEKQKEWIRDYKKREAIGTEYYFIYFYNSQPFGVNRIYNITQDSATSGSWICLPGYLPQQTVATSFILRDILFEYLLLNEDKFDVRINNLQVNKLNKLFGSEIVSQDESNYYWLLTKEQYYKNKNKIMRLLSL